MMTKELESFRKEMEEEAQTWLAGRRYPILYCYGYGISIEQLFEKLPKKED